MEQILECLNDTATYNNKPYKIISIEGNIGSGKTTLLNHLKKEFKENEKVVFLKEPVDDWEEIKDEAGNTMIQKFYTDQEKYSFSFQMMAYISRLALLKQTIHQYKDSTGMIFITERCLYTDKYVFAKMLFDSGKIELVNYKIYCKWFDTFFEEDNIDKIVYIKTDTEICLSRIDKRGRNGENSIPLEYLSSCHEYHENMMKLMNHTQIQVINGNVNVLEIKDYIEE
jgi:deoxyadenosine/deoxycytidine kinase